MGPGFRRDDGCVLVSPRHRLAVRDGKARLAAARSAVILRMMSEPRYLAGQLLLSMPGIGDARFDRAVIAMCVHDDDGALGIIVNAPLPALRVHELMAQLDVAAGVTPDVPVHAGGPVEPGRGFVLHSTDWSGQSTIHVAGEYALTSTLDVLKAIAAGTGPKQWLSALGYTGWAAGPARRRADAPRLAQLPRRRRAAVRHARREDVAARLRDGRDRHRPSVGERRARLS